MTGKTIGTIIAVVLLVLVGFWIFNGNDGDIALDGNNATTTEEANLTGTGGPDDEDFDPFEGIDNPGSGDVNFDENGEIIPEKG